MTLPVCNAFRIRAPANPISFTGFPPTARVRREFDASCRKARGQARLAASLPLKSGVLTVGYNLVQPPCAGLRVD
jgi:hypothetical protein